jgi:flagellar motility protein MotE (MotC chaperone)
MKQIFKKINIFTILVVVVTLSLGMRLSSFVDSVQNDTPLPMVSVASAVENVVGETPPPVMPDAEKALSSESRIQQDRGLPEFPVTTFSESEIEVLQSLAVRRQDLETREKRLSQREALLNAAEQEVDRKINELGALRDELTTLLDQQDKVQESRLNRMVKIYETMKPKDAAVIFNTLDMDVLLAVIGRMSERKSAPIFANMNPERSREVTIKLVEQGRLPALPKE